MNQNIITQGLGEDQRLILRGYGGEYTYLGDEVFTSRPRIRVDKEENIFLYSRLFKEKIFFIPLKSSISKIINESLQLKVNLQKIRLEQMNMLIPIDNVKLSNLLKAL